MTAAESVAALTLAIMLGFNNIGSAASAQQSRAQSMTTSAVAERIGEPGWLFVDVRDSNAFNGWVTGDEKRGGSIQGAANLALAWIDERPTNARQLVESLGLDDNKIVLYGDSASEAHQTANLLHRHAQLSWKQMFVYSEGIAAWSRDDDLPMDRLPRYEQLVPPAWLHRLIEDDAREFRVVEAAWRKKGRYLAGHIPGAIYLDTDEIESLPLWNIVSTRQLERTLLSLGITKDTLVVLYSRGSTAAARAALVMMYAGVSDVRVLNGGYQAWRTAGLSVASGDVERQPSMSFGANIPVHPEWIVGTEEAKQVLADQDGRLVSIRSWPEYTGQQSGYQYIKPKGRIPGAAWGHAGTDRDHMQDFRNPDDTMRDYHRIAAMWRDWDITPQHRINFYCGTGWRASEAFFAAYLMGYENISVYDGGWFEWSTDKDNPVDTGIPAAAAGDAVSKPE